MKNWQSLLLVLIALIALFVIILRKKKKPLIEADYLIKPSPPPQVEYPPEGRGEGQLLPQVEYPAPAARYLAPPVVEYPPEGNELKLPQVEYKYNPDERKFPIPGKVSKGQRKVCLMIEKKLGKEFLWNHRPDFLKVDDTGANLELDCYSPELGIAVEYDGEQHVNGDHFFHGGSREKFERLIACDKTKDLICPKEGIYLIRIPHNFTDRQIEQSLDAHIAKWRSMRR